jgi:hypothetical protein
MKKWMEGSLLVATLTIAGCELFAPPPNPAAVLEGTWQAVFDEPGDFENVQLIFDADGALTQITAESPGGGTASLDVAGTTTSEVDGNQVTITVPAIGGARVFQGTLSEDEKSIDGSLSQELELQLPSGDLGVTLPGSDLTLTRLES